MTNTYTHIVTVTLASPGSFQIDNLPQTFRHLRLDFSVNRSDFFGATGQNLVRFNGSNAGQTVIYSASASPLNSASWASTNLGENNAGGVVEIPNYSVADVRKTFWMFGTETDGGGTPSGAFVAGRSDLTAAITSIALLHSGGNQFSTGSRLTIYGVNG